VLKLLAHGLTDREIAQQLIVSPHTVHRHVANIVTSSAADLGRRRSPKRLAWDCSEPAALRRLSHPSAAPVCVDHRNGPSVANDRSGRCAVDGASLSSPA
jgi:hypothetical protein